MFLFLIDFLESNFFIFFSKIEVFICKKKKKNSFDFREIKEEDLILESKQEIV